MTTREKVSVMDMTDEALAEYMAEVHSAGLEFSIDSGKMQRAMEHAFDSSRPRRLLSGIAVSTPAQINGFQVLARQVHFKPATPLLYAHKSILPVGRVLKFKPRGFEVHFKAEIANNPSLEWIAPVWELMRARLGATCVSISALALDGQRMSAKGYQPWRLTELSIVDNPADKAASIMRCWEVQPGGGHIEHWSAG